MTDGLPTFQVARIERLRDRVVLLLLQYVNRPLEGLVFDQVCIDLYQHLQAERHAVTASLLPLAGRSLTRADMFKLAWRFAGNVERLRAGEAVCGWSRRPDDEWVPLQVLNVTPAKDKHNRPGNMLKMRVLAGSPCPDLLLDFWTVPRAAAVSRRAGFTRAAGRYPWHHTSEFVGLRLLGKISAARSIEKPVLSMTVATSSMVAANRRDFLALRSRHPKAAGCPFKFQHQCYHCSYGYDTCDGGVHPRNYEIGTCASCGLDDQLFDLDWDPAMCRACVTRERSR